MAVKIIISLLLLSVISYTDALNVSQCHDIAKPIDKLTERVKVGTCKKPPCRLRKNTNIPVELRFTPDKDIASLKNTILAYLTGIPLPFPGYDQTDACPSIYSADGTKEVGCPLKKGEEYLYKKSIEVLQIYPRVKVIVHWALTAPDGNDVICFETPARITN